MKKVIFLMLFAFVAFANNSTAQVVSMGAADTVVDTGSKSFARNLKVGLNANVSIQVVINRLSGTAAGTAVVWGAVSNGDTLVYLPYDTLVLSNQSVNSKVFDYPSGKFTHYKVTVTGSGTTTMRARAWLYARKTD